MPVAGELVVYFRIFHRLLFSFNLVFSTFFQKGRLLSCFTRLHQKLVTTLQPYSIWRGGGGGSGHYGPLLVFLKERSLITAEEGLEDQGWISDMGIDGPTFVPKSGYFLLIWVKVCPQKLAFSYFFSQFYEMAFLTKCWLFQTRNPPLSLFLAFLAVVFS